MGIGMLVGPSEGWVGWIPLIELKNPRCPFHASWKILIPYSRLTRIDKTDIKNSERSQLSDFWDFDILENNIFENEYGFVSWISGPKVKNNGFWGSWAFVLVPKGIQMKTFGTFAKWNLKVTSSLWILILLRRFWPFQSSTTFFAIRSHIADRAPVEPLQSSMYADCACTVHAVHTANYCKSRIVLGLRTRHRCFGTAAWNSNREPYRGSKGAMGQYAKTKIGVCTSIVTLKFKNGKGQKLRRKVRVMGN